MPAQRIIVDCDPGQDDALALFLALGAPEALDIVGITTVAGNVGVDLTERNARMICELAGRADIKVHAGCSRPLVREPVHAPDVHGSSGLDGLEIFEPRLKLQAAHGVDFLIRALLAEDDGAVTLACIAPLTNIAMALVMEPAIGPKIRAIVLMGGARREGGNVTPAATFNIHSDPHAAHIVFTSGIPLVVVGLDVTSQVRMTRARLAEIALIGNRPAAAICSMLSWDYERRVGAYGAGSDGLPVNDLCVMAYLLDRRLFAGANFNIAIELQSALTMGMTVVDVWGVSGRPANAFWLHAVDSDGVLRLLVDRLRRL